MLAIAFGGVVAFLAVEHSGRFHLNATAAPAEIGASLIALSFVLTFAHELGHASVEKHFGRNVGTAGFSLYFGRLSFYVNASDSLMMDRWPRILLFAAGPFAELVLAGLASIVLFTFPDMRVAPFLYRFALLNLFVIILNLVPLLGARRILDPHGSDPGSRPPPPVARVHPARSRSQGAHAGTIHPAGASGLPPTGCWDRCSR